MKPDPHEVALSAAYMGFGLGLFMSKGMNGVKVHKTLQHHALSELDAMSELAGMAERLEWVYLWLSEDVRDSAPGVWAYEVAEELGRHYGEALASGQVPNLEWQNNAIAERVAQFFGDAGLVPSLITTLWGYPL